MVDKNLSPIVLFVYNRPWHTEQTVNALKKNELASESDLFIFSDGPKFDNDENVGKVREYIKTIDGFKSVTIIEREKNLGLANSVIAGVTEIINKYGKAIVLEDDIVTAPNFLEFMNEALDKYEQDEHIYSVSGFLPPIKIPDDYTFPVFLGYRNSSWGWGTWKNMWKDVDWEVSRWDQIKKDKELWKKLQRGGEDLPYMLKLQMEKRIDSWSIRFCAAHSLKNRFTVFPVKTLAKNIGLDGSGVHCGKSVSNIKYLIASEFAQLPEHIPLSETLCYAMKEFYKYGLKDKVRRYVKNMLGMR